MKPFKIPQKGAFFLNTKLLIVEGLPGFGKSTSAKLLKDILIDNHKQAELFLEGNLDHPADYDGVASFNKSEFESLIANNGDFRELINNKVTRKGNNYLLPYRKLINEYGSHFPDDLFHTIFKNDIYELSLEKNIELITQRWTEFAEKAINENKVYIFECCFIQNPLTIGMVKYGSQKDKVIDYVLRLEKIIEKLNPILVYIEQDDLEFSFRKAVNERSTEWSKGFVDYYTNQGYGKRKGYKGLEGTIKVLEARRAVENDIFDLLTIKKIKINNSNYEFENYKIILNERMRSMEILG